MPESWRRSRRRQRTRRTRSKVSRRRIAWSPTDARQGPALANYATKTLHARKASRSSMTPALYGQGLANEFAKAVVAGGGRHHVAHEATNDKATGFQGDPEEDQARPAGRDDVRRHGRNGRPVRQTGGGARHQGKNSWRRRNVFHRHGDARGERRAKRGVFGTGLDAVENGQGQRTSRRST